jgi:hypothetical protein
MRWAQHGGHMSNEELIKIFWLETLMRRGDVCDVCMERQDITEINL